MTTQISIHVRGPLATTDAEHAPVVTGILTPIVTELARQFDPQGPPVDAGTYCRSDQEFHFPSVFLDRIVEALRAQEIEPCVIQEMPRYKFRFDPPFDGTERQVASEVVGRPRALFLLDPASPTTEQDVVRAIASTQRGRIVRPDFDRSPPSDPSIPDGDGQCLVITPVHSGVVRRMVQWLLHGRLSWHRYYAILHRRPRSAEEAIGLYALFGGDACMLTPRSRTRCPIEFVENPMPDRLSPLMFALSIAGTIGISPAGPPVVDRQPDQQDGRLRPGHLLGDRPQVYVVVDRPVERNDDEGRALIEAIRRQGLRIITRPEMRSTCLAGSIVLFTGGWTLSDLAAAEKPESLSAPPRLIVALTDSKSGAFLSRVV